MQARSSVWLERFLDTEEVDGSSPFGPTNIRLYEEQVPRPPMGSSGFRLAAHTPPGRLNFGSNRVYHISPKDSIACV